MSSPIAPNQQATVDLKDVNVDVFDEIDYSQYDAQRYLKSNDGSLEFEYRIIKGDGTLPPLHDFMPFGMNLSFPLLRAFNASCTGNYGGDIRFYAMHEVKFRYNPELTSPILEQLADKWLETYNASNGPRTITLAGASMGGFFAAIIGAKAKSYGIEVTRLFLFEPAGVSAKSLKDALKQINNDTVFDFSYSLNKLQSATVKFNIYKRLFTHMRYEREVIKEMLSGKLPHYLNEYYQNEPHGKVVIFHSHESTYITYKNLADFHATLEEPKNIFYVHAKGAKHGMGPHYRQLAKTFLDFMTRSQSAK